MVVAVIPRSKKNADGRRSQMRNVCIERVKFSFYFISSEEKKGEKKHLQVCFICVQVSMQVDYRYDG